MQMRIGKKAAALFQNNATAFFNFVLFPQDGKIVHSDCNQKYRMEGNYEKEIIKCSSKYSNDCKRIKRLRQFGRDTGTG